MRIFSASQVPLPAIVDDKLPARRWLKACMALSLLCLLNIHIGAQTATAVNVPMWRYGNASAGANSQETLLNVSNVNTTSFGKLFSVAVDGYVYAQPLYVAGITMPDGLVHNVIFIATEHDSVYAFDADTNGGANAQPLWKVSMIDTAHGAAAGATTVPNSAIGSLDIVPEVGITSTPVYNLASQTLYVVAKSEENGSYIQRIHALNMLNGSEQANSPSQPIAATVTGGGNGSANGKLAFSSLWQLNRVALNLFNGYLYVAFGSHGDNGPWHGWVLAYNATTLNQTGVFCLSPNGLGNGVWSSGAAMPIDTVNPSGRMFLTAGNGTLTTYPPLSTQTDYSNSVLRLDLGSGTLTPGSAFTPFNQAALTSSDLDQGSGGELLLPDQPGTYPHELLQIGKEGRILLLNRDSLGGYAPGGSSNTNIIQDITGATGGLWSTPAYWNGHVFMWASGDSLKRFELTNGLLSTTASSNSTVKSSFPGATPVVSSNGTQNAIVWAVRSDAYNSNGSAILYAFDASNLTTPIYESDTNSARDDAGPANKFTPPVITNGKVYVGAAYQVDVYGLLNGAQTAAAPVISPNGGTLMTPQQATITAATPGSTIYYTTDGSLPTAAASVYTAPITISTGTTIRAIASVEGYLQSAVSTAVFTFLTQTPAPAFSLAAGTYTSAQTVTIGDSLSNAVIYYTTDGSTPTLNSSVYSGPITVSTTETLQAIAVSGTLTPSLVTSATYSLQYSGTGINFGSGFSVITGLTLNGSTVNSDDSRLQLTTGGTNQTGSVFYNTPMNIQSFVNDFSFQLSNPQADGFTFTIQNVSPKALGISGGSLGYGADITRGTGGIPNSIAIKFDLYSNTGEGPNSTGIYQNAAPPTLPAINLTPSGINLHSGDSMNVHMTYDGTTLTMTITDPVSSKTFTQSFPINISQVIGSNTAYIGFTGGTGGLTSSQKILTWTFVSNPQPAAPSPVITPNGGTFTSPQSVSISDTATGAVIYYTTDSSTPTISSPVYNGPFTISSGSVAVKAFAVAPAMSASPINSANFTVTLPTTALPSFSPAAGTYVGTQVVSIADATAGAVIYYTTDGSTPTPSSNTYSGPITVTASQTINAIALAPNYAISGVSSAAYVIQSTGQSINYGSGFTSTSNIALNGSAKLNSPASALQLTDGHVTEAGSAWVTTPVNVTAFISDFTFQMVKPVADGFTFAIQSNGTSAIGGSGGSLGYANIPNSVALKFDIYSNSGEGTDSIGIYTGGAAPTVPATNLTGSGIVLNSGDVFHVHLVYNGTALQVGITDTNTSASYMVAYPVNIPGALGTSQGYVGFTGGTGGSTVTTNIMNWTLTPVSQTVTADPTFSPAPGSYTTAAQVTLNSLTPNATIYYTVDGSQPSHTSAVYSGPIQVNGNSLTVKAFASAAGLQDSPIVTGSYVIQQPGVAQPVLSPAAGTYSSVQVISLSSPVSGAALYYTIDGTTPTAASPLYSAPIMISGSKTIQAIAVVPGVGQSSVTTGVYVIQDGGQAVNFASGFANAQGLTFNGNAANPNDGTLKITDTSATYEAGSTFFNVPVDIRQFQTSFTFQQTNAVADGFTFTIQSNAPTALGPSGGGLGYGPATTTGKAGIPNSVAIKFDLFNNLGEGTDSTGLYQGGASPTIPAVNLTPSGIVLTKGDPMLAKLTYDGTTLTLNLTDQKTNATFTQGFPVNIPAAVNSTSAYVGFTGGTGGLTAYQKILNWTFMQTTATPAISPASGTYTSGQTITMSDTTPNAVIYYTLDGSTPTNQSLVYTGPLTITNSSETVNAIAIASSYAPSAEATATYSLH